MGLFRATHGLAGAKRSPSLKSVNDETWHSYNLPKEDPKNI